MTIRRRNSNDTQDDLSTDTNLSNTSELFLARIQQETNRIRKKRQGRKDSTTSTASKSLVGKKNRKDPTANVADLSKKKQISTRQQQTFESTTSTNTWNNKVVVVQDNKVESAPPKPQIQLSEDDSEEYEASSEYLVGQRGDSVARLNEFDNSPAQPSPTTNSTSTSTSTSTSYWTGTRKSKMASEELKQKEAFQKKLIDEVLGKDAGDKVSMEKVMMILWQFRDDKEVIKFMTRFVCKFAGSRDVFDGIEFYLPQLAHMMIHLEAESDDTILEQFSLVIAQQSIHFALQLNWILSGAIEDYQPELPDGNPNPTYNPLYYFRCVKLLTNIERCVVYRTPRSQELQRLYEKGKITKAEMVSLEQADRRFTAMQITAGTPDMAFEDREIFGGTLKYKRAIRTSRFKFKRWKTRYFAIEERMLNCYNTDGGTLIRSMPLEGATVQSMSSKYPNMFSVTNRSFEFRMRGSSEEDRNKWIKMLQNEAKTGRVFGHTDDSLFGKNNEDAERVIQELTPSQRERYRFYRNEREFVRRLTDIAEDLRFQEPADRKLVAPGMLEKLDIPSHAYSPLMSSTDIFRRIHSSFYKDTRVFNTKARCPTVMYFLGVRGELEYKGLRHANMDIAEYIHLKFDAASDWKTKPLIKGEVTNDEVEHTLSGIKEETEDSEILTPTKAKSNGDSFVWTGSFTQETPVKDDNTNSPSRRMSSERGKSPSRANRHLKKFLKESMVKVPRKLAHHLERKSTKLKSLSGQISDSSLASNVVPIAQHTSENHGIGEDAYIGRSSVMDHDKIIKGNTKAGEIDPESINRAKQIISGGESWAEKSFRMLENVQDKPKDGKVLLDIVSFITKSNDDLRQEVFVMQMIHYYKSVFIAADIPLWLKTYKILSTSASTGFLEFMVDSTSLDGLKKSEDYPKEGGLRKYFEVTYGGPDSKSFKAAQRNFVQSLAAYSIVCYLLGLKDRHNGNIMIDMRGHLIHIDYGFCFGMNVGHEFTLERAPFKLTEEYVEVMGGTSGESYLEFQKLFVEGMVEARSKCQIALGMVEIMMYQSNYPCFSGRRYGGGQALRGFRERLMLDVPDEQVEAKVLALIETARDHWGTRAYDKFQEWSNGLAI